MSDALRLVAVQRSFHQGGQRLDVLRGVDLALAAGEAVGLLGPSGAGKSTLLHIAGLLEKADGGEVVIAGRSCAGMSDLERTRVRRESIGFVYQFHHLLPEFSAVENVALPQMVAGASRAQAAAVAGDLLRNLGLGERLTHRPAQLSGGEQQRVALARAIANQPSVLLADEPTGDLDAATADLVFDELLGMVRARDMGALIATHNTDLARRLDRVVRLANGVLQPA